MRRRSTLAGTLTLLGAQAIGGVPFALAQTPNNTFVFGAPGDPVKLDPADVSDGESARITEQIFDTLVMFDGATTNLKPGLAQSWDVSEDGLSYFFNLRPGVTFHDGTPCDAEAVAWNFHRWMDEDNPWRAGGTFEYWSDVAAFNEVVRDVRAISPQTVQIDLIEPQGTLLLNLALFAFAIASPTAMMADIQNAYRRPVGTGPFRFSEWIPGDRVVLERNPRFWGQQARVERVVVRSIPDNAARYLALRSGSIDMMEGINAEDVPAAQRDQNLRVILRPPLNIGYVNLNLDVAPLNNVNVRHAIASAINRPAIVEALFGGTGAVASQHIPPSVMGWNPEVPGPRFDQARARQLLADAGLASGFSIDFWVMPVSRPYFPNPQAIAEAITADLARVGIRANLRRETDWGTYLQRRNRLEYPMWMLGWTGDNGDPDNFLYTFFGPAPDNSWRNQAVQGLLRQAQRSPDLVEREAIYRQVNAVVDAEMPRIPIAHNSVPLVARSYVQGYVANPTATEFYNTVSVNR